MYGLANYQKQAVESIFDLASKQKIHLQVAPTGAGKTVITAFALHQIEKRGQKALFLVDGQELLGQGYNTFRANFSLDCGYVDANRKSMPRTKIVTAMIQTLKSRIEGKHANYWRDQLKTFDYIFIDEAHVLTAVPLIEKEVFNGSIIGLTATPVCTGKTPLSHWYQTMHEITTTQNLVQEGYLVPLIYRYDSDDMSDLKTRGQDFNEKKVFEEMRKRGKVSNLVPLIRQTEQKYGQFFTREHLKGIVYANGTEYIKELRDLMRSQGISTDYILSNPKYQTKTQREYAISNFKSNLIDWLANIMVLTKGFDDKEISIVSKMFRTTSISKNFQVDGRVARVNVQGLHAMKSADERRDAIAKSSKPFGIVMDLGGNYKLHGRFDAPRNWEVFFNGNHKSNGEGNAPMKECPKCNSFIHASLPKCTELMPIQSAQGIFMQECGHLFPKKELREREVQLTDDIEPNFMQFTEPPKPLKDRSFDEIYEVLSRKRGYEMEKIFLKRHCWKEDFSKRFEKLEKEQVLPYLNRLVLAKVLTGEQGIELIRPMLVKKARHRAFKRSSRGLKFENVVKQEHTKIARIIQQDKGKTDFEKYCNTLRKY